MARVADLFVRHFLIPLCSTGKRRVKLLKELATAHSQLRAAFDACPADERFVRVREAELACVADVLAHLGSANFGYREALRRIETGDETSVAWGEFGVFAGAEGRSWDELMERFERSHAGVAAGINACSGKYAVSSHPWYGSLTWQQWTALMVLHYGYHRDQLARFAGQLSSRG